MAIIGLMLPINTVALQMHDEKNRGLRKKVMHAGV